MTTRDIDSIIDEFYSCRLSLDDDSLSALEAALFLEECFSITLNDRDIAELNPGARESVRALVMERLGA